MLGICRWLMYCRTRLVLRRAGNADEAEHAALLGEAACVGDGARRFARIVGDNEVDLAGLAVRHLDAAIRVDGVELELDAGGDHADRRRRARDRRRRAQLDRRFGDAGRWLGERSRRTAHQVAGGEKG